MVLLFSFKEHFRFMIPPFVTFGKDLPCEGIFWLPSWFACHSDTPSNARQYIFCTIDRHNLQGKYIRFRWGRCVHWFVTPVWRARIYDGTYDRKNPADWPHLADFPLKGNGLLQTLSDAAPFPTSFGGTIIDQQVDVSGGIEDEVTLFFWNDDPDAAESSLLLDFVEINTGPGGAGNLYRDHMDGTTGLQETFNTYYDYGRLWNEPGVNLHCGFNVRNCKDFSDSLGIAFYWYGSGKDELVDLFLRTPTGTLVASFADGPAHFRWVYIPWGEMVETGIDGSIPDKTMICAILWTLHSPGIRRLDHVVQYFCRDLSASFYIRRTATPINLKGKLRIRRSATNDIKGNLVIAHVSSKNLSSKLKIQRQSTINIKAGFLPRRLQPATSTLRGTFDVGRYAVDLGGKLEIPRGYRWIPSKIFLGEDFGTYIEIDGVIG